MTGNLNFIGQKLKVRTIKSDEDAYPAEQTSLKIETVLSPLYKKSETELSEPADILSSKLHQLETLPEDLKKTVGPQLEVFIEQMNLLLKDSDSVGRFEEALVLCTKFYKQLENITQMINSLIVFSMDEGVVSEQNVRDFVKYKFLQEKLVSFLGIFNHDFVRTTSHGIKGLLELLIGLGGDELQEQDRQEYNEYVLDMVNDLRIFFEEILLVVSAPEFMDIFGSQFFKEDMDRLLIRSAQKEVILEGNILEEFSVFSDPERLKLILRNFLNNAIKFTESGGRVSLSTALEGDRIIFSVTDTGTGLNKQALKEQQELFNNESPKEKERLTHHSEGTNQEATTAEGLILSKKYADDIFGKIAVESKKGEGATYTLSLPVNKEEVHEKDHIEKGKQEIIVQDEVKEWNKRLLKNRFCQMFNDVMEKK